MSLLLDWLLLKRGKITIFCKKCSLFGKIIRWFLTKNKYGTVLCSITLFQSVYWRNVCSPLFTAALLAVTNTWKQPTLCINGWIDLINVFYLCNGIYSVEKEGILSLLINMCETSRHYVVWCKPDSKRQMPYDLIYVWNLRGRHSGYPRL